MQLFTALYRALDESTRTNEKVEGLVQYFKQAKAADAIWAVALLIGKRPKRPIKSNLIREWAVEEAGISDWLFQECYEVVGDMSETISLLTQKKKETEVTALHEVMNRLHLLGKMEAVDQKTQILEYWRQLEQGERFLINKLLGGSFRVGVSENLVVRALAKVSQIDEKILTHRLMGNWVPTETFYHTLISPNTHEEDHSKPYPFCLAYALDIVPEELGPINKWNIEWKWDGIRSQLIKRNGDLFIWTRGEELVTDRYPEIKDALQFLPDGTVIDGELLAWKNQAPLPFIELQKRIGRKLPGKKLLADIPVHAICYDLLELNGIDLRDKPFEVRRVELEKVLHQINHPHLLCSPLLTPGDWAEAGALRKESRNKQAEGLMIKQKQSAYKAGRKRGDWWKWKIEPYIVDAVLIYAQSGTGKRANLYTDYTFAVWNDNKVLVPFAKAYSGLSNEEIQRVDKFIRANTLEKFGPVRTVKAELVFELAFEGINFSKRHKSGVAVRFPRISRWRTDKKAEDADNLESIKKLISLSQNEADLL